MADPMFSRRSATGVEVDEKEDHRKKASLHEQYYRNQQVDLAAVGGGQLARQVRLSLNQRLSLKPCCFSEEEEDHCCGISLDLKDIGGGVDPCLQSYMTDYFLRTDVQRAIHAKKTNIHRLWFLCSGELDARVPIIATKYSLAKLRNYGIKIKEFWKPWYHKEEVGGWVTDYDGLTFITVRYAGHQVPLDAPKQALQVVKAFIEVGAMKLEPF